MIKQNIIFLFLVFFTFSGCKNKLTNFNLDENFQTTIPASSPIDLPFTVYTSEQTTNSEFEFESNDTRKDKIEQIILEELRITITSPQGEDFSFLNNLEIFLSSTTQSEEEIAYLNDISENIGDELNCKVIGQDLQKFVKDDKYKIRLVTVTDEIITQDIDVNIYTNFFVDAKLIN